jgi:hypothetical protein
MNGSNNNNKILLTCWRQQYQHNPAQFPLMRTLSLYLGKTRKLPCNVRGQYARVTLGNRQSGEPAVQEILISGCKHPLHPPCAAGWKICTEQSDQVSGLVTLNHAHRDLQFRFPFLAKCQPIVSTKNNIRLGIGHSQSTTQVHRWPPF